MTVADTFGADDPHYRLAEDTITVAPLLAQLPPEDWQWVAAAATDTWRCRLLRLTPGSTAHLDGRRR
jgi:hypothetical protein